MCELYSDPRLVGSIFPNRQSLRWFSIISSTHTFSQQFCSIIVRKARRASMARSEPEPQSSCSPKCDIKSLLRNCKKHPDSGRDVDIQCKILTLVSIECHVVAVPGRPTLAANLTPEVNARVCGTSP